MSSVTSGGTSSRNGLSQSSAPSLPPLPSCEIDDDEPWPAWQGGVRLRACGRRQRSVPCPKPSTLPLLVEGEFNEEEEDREEAVEEVPDDNPRRLLQAPCTPAT